jgi:DNA replication licensing factor MCM2
MDSAPSSPLPAGAQSPPPLSEAGSQASDMAQEVNRIEDEPDVIEDEGDGEDLEVNIERDYKRIEGLDNYEAEGLDATTYKDIGFRARERAEAEMRKRDREKMKTEGRMAQALQDDFDEEDDEYYRMRERRRRTQRREVPEDEEDEGEYFVDGFAVDLDDPKGPLNEWIIQEAVTRKIANEFKNFLQTYIKGGIKVYNQRISDMCSANKESLEVSFMELSQKAPHLAVYVADAPIEMLKIFDETAMSVALGLFKRYKEGISIQELHVRITELPICDSLRDIRKIHLNTLIKVSGVVTRRTGVFPQLKSCKYDCMKCGFILGPYIVPPSGEAKPSSCPECQGKGPFVPNMEQTIYRNYQKMTLQESPGTVPAGRLPRTKEVIPELEQHDVEPHVKIA